jgi:uncharacterized tellurite resistance protein B-like protein
MERGVAGFNILTLLSMADGRSHPNEDLVIRNWLIQEFAFSKNLDAELELLTHLKPKDKLVFLQNQMDAFYKESTLKERNNLLQFAINVIKADGKIAAKEDNLFDYLYNGWNEE